MVNYRTTAISGASGVVFLDKLADGKLPPYKSVKCAPAAPDRPSAGRLPRR